MIWEFPKSAIVEHIIHHGHWKLASNLVYHMEIKNTSIPNLLDGENSSWCSRILMETSLFNQLGRS